MRRRAGLAAVSALALLIAACGSSQPATKGGGSGVGMSMSMQVRPTDGGCGPAPADLAVRDAAGVGWWMEGKRWCRAADGARPAQVWIAGPSGPGSKRLVVEGRTVAVLDAQVGFQPLAGIPAAAPFIRCGNDVRSRAFAAQNRLRERGDLACGRTFAGPGFSLTAVGFPGTAGIMPALATAPAKEAMGTIVYLPGGPYENLAAGFGERATINHLLANWAGRAAVVIPAYLGIDRIRMGAGDAGRAREEVDALIAALDRRAPVCVIGFSLGGAIAAASVARHPRAAFLLAAPLATSPVTFTARAAAQGRKPRPIALTPVTRGGSPLTLSSDRALLDYFAGSENRDLASLLGPGRHPNLRIAHAAGDIPVLRRDLSAIAPTLEPGAIRELPAEVGHSIETPFGASAYRPLIDDFLGDCLVRRDERRVRSAGGAIGGGHAHRVDRKARGSGRAKG